MVRAHLVHCPYDGIATLDLKDKRLEPNRKCDLRRLGRKAARRAAAQLHATVRDQNAVQQRLEAHQQRVQRILDPVP